jgi:hypothetical protein
MMNLFQSQSKFGKTLKRVQGDIKAFSAGCRHKHQCQVIAYRLFTPELSDYFKTVIARSGATRQSLSLKTRFLTEPVLSETKRFFALLRMTVSEGFGMTILKASSIINRSIQVRVISF